MVRTLESGSGVRASGGKAPRKGVSAPSSSAVSGEGSRHSGGSSGGGGGNPYCPRETPAWQKPITAFFKTDLESSGKNSGVENAEMKEVEDGEKVTDGDSEKENDPPEANESTEKDSLENAAKKIKLV